MKKHLGLITIGNTGCSVEFEEAGNVTAFYYTTPQGVPLGTMTLNMDNISYAESRVLAMRLVPQFFDKSKA